MIVESLKAKEYTSNLNLIDFDIIIEALLDFIEDNFKEFSKKNSSKKYNEEYLTQRLVILLLQNSIEKPFIFVQENVELGKRSKVDIGIYTREKDYDNEAFFVIEAKRLPAPPPKERKTEYVIGNKKNGAIERFKRKNHGEFSKGWAIIAYVEENEFNYWLSKINSWIEEVAQNNTDSTINWNKLEILKEIKSHTFFGMYLSENMRTGGTNIGIKHYFVKMY